MTNNPQSAIRNPKFEGFSVEWDPRFIEEAVLRVVEARRVQGFRGERNRLYEIQDPEERDAAFREFHAAWFERLNLGGVIWQALQEQPLILANTRACIVAQARASRDEGAELFVSPAGEGVGEAERRSVGIRLGPQRLLDADHLLTFLRHELLHIADMLEPAFGYEPRLPRAELGPAHERLLQDRYRVLWDTSIDGRLVRRNWAPPSVRDRRFHEFTKTFPMLSERLEEAFARFFDAASVTHADLVSFATNPARQISDFGFRISDLPTDPQPPSSNPRPRSSVSGPQRGERCPLCGFPTHAFEPDPAQLPRGVQDQIRSDFPMWHPTHGICQQCSDLYRSRSLSPITAS
ncbi:MAG: hypothetical protein HYY88_05305 [candidate division NC10 bacterium]|nr:hypothetical protein [candidate division NC10 bacterium]